MAKECLRCGVGDNITRDHVVPRATLKQILGRDKYPKFSAESRYVNIQPLCSECNNLKGNRTCDYRDHNKAGDLQMLLHRWGILTLIDFEDI